MSSTLQQRVCIKFCVENGFNGAQTLEMLEKCFGNDTLTRSNVFRWHERFRSGRGSVEDQTCRCKAGAERPEFHAKKGSR